MQRRARPAPSVSARRAFIRWRPPRTAARRRHPRASSGIVTAGGRARGGGAGARGGARGTRPGSRARGRLSGAAERPPSAPRSGARPRGGDPVRRRRRGRATRGGRRRRRDPDAHTPFAASRPDSCRMVSATVDGLSARARREPSCVGSSSRPHPTRRTGASARASAGAEDADERPAAIHRQKRAYGPSVFGVAARKRQDRWTARFDRRRRLTPKTRCSRGTSDDEATVRATRRFGGSSARAGDAVATRSSASGGGGGASVTPRRSWPRRTPSIRAAASSLREACALSAEAEWSSKPPPMPFALLHCRRDLAADVAHRSCPTALSITCERAVRAPRRHRRRRRAPRRSPHVRA